GGDHQVARLQALGDLVVGDIEAARHLQRADPGRARRAEQLVRDQRHRQLRALRGAVQDFLDGERAGVGVDPDVHRWTIVGTSRTLNQLSQHSWWRQAYRLT